MTTLKSHEKIKCDNCKKLGVIACKLKKLEGEKIVTFTICIDCVKDYEQLKGEFFNEQR